MTGKEAKAAIQECVSEFIGFITSEASDRLTEDKRKTITGDDVVQGMQVLGFDAYMQFLSVYLKRYRQQTVKGNTQRNNHVNSNQQIKRVRKNEPTIHINNNNLHHTKIEQYQSIDNTHAHVDAHTSPTTANTIFNDHESMQKRQKSVG